MSFIYEFQTAYLPEANLSIACGICGKELVNCAEVGWLAWSIVVIACNDYLVTEPQGLAPKSSGVVGFGNL